MYDDNYNLTMTRTPVTRTYGITSKFSTILRRSAPGFEIKILVRVEGPLLTFLCLYMLLLKINILC